MKSNGLFLNNLEKSSNLNMLRDHSTSIVLQECIANMLLEQCTFQIWFWSIFNLRHSSRLLMVQDHMVLMVQNHIKSRPKSQKKRLMAGT